MAIHSKLSNTPIAIVEHEGRKSGGWRKQTYVKVRIGDEQKLRSYRLDDLIADGGQAELDAAVAQAKRNTVARHLTSARKAELLRIYRRQVDHDAPYSRGDSRAHSWLRENDVILGYSSKLEGDMLMMARDLYIAERGIGAMWRSLAEYVNRTSGVTGFMKLLKDIPTMLSTQMFANEGLYSEEWIIEPSGGNHYTAKWNGDDISLTIRQNTRYMRTDQGDFKAVNLGYCTDLDLTHYLRDSMTAEETALVSALLADASLIARRLNETLEGE